MAVAPLFVLDMPTLKASLRLGELLAHDAASPILDTAVKFARVTVIEALGESAVAHLVGLARTENPATMIQARRVKAEMLETDLILMYLTKHLPMAFLDGGGGMLNFYKQEAPFRLQDPLSRAELVKDLEARVNKYLQDLSLQLRGEANSCEVNTGSAPCAAVLGTLSDTEQAPLLAASLDSSYLQVNRKNLRTLPGIFL